MHFVNGFHVFSHITSTFYVEKFPETIKKTTDEVVIKAKDERFMVLKKDDFEKQCHKHYERNYEDIMAGEILTLPNPDQVSDDTDSISNIPFITTLRTMKDWCCKKQKKGKGNGFVFYEYDLYSHFKFLNYQGNIFEGQYSARPVKDFIIVYSQFEKVIFLIRKANNENLEVDLKLSTIDMMIFLLVFHDILEKSGITLINLLATDKEVDVKCKSCKCQVIPVRSLTSSDTFEEWRKEAKSNFKPSDKSGKIDEKFSQCFAARILGFLASIHYKKEKCSNERRSLNLDDMLQKFTELLFLTREQLDIVHSPDKHIIIKGCYGSGKTVVAHKKIETITHTLDDNDSLWYISCDSRSKLGEDIKLLYKGEKNIQVFCNEKEEPGSVILQKILKNDLKRGKLNLIFDEFDGETLDEAEAKILYHEFKTNKRLKDSSITLIPQPLEIERFVNKSKKQGNEFAILKMKILTLTRNMRNTLEINRLAETTVKALENHKPIYFHSQGSEGRETKIEIRRQDVNTRDGGQEVKVKTRTKIKFHLSKDTEEDGSTDHKKFKLDEAYQHTMPTIEESTATRVISTFQHKISDKPRRKKKGKLPNLFEIECSEDNTKLIIQLIAMLKNIYALDNDNQPIIKEIANLYDLEEMEKHVILHFDTQKDIPDVFSIMFKVMNLSDRVTTKYDEFKNDEKKIFFICSYRTFRGLEYARVIVVVDSSLHHLLHYIPECFSRCTTFLHICKLCCKLNFVGNSKFNQPFDDMINAWKEKQSYKLVEQRKIELSEYEKDCIELSLLIDTQKVTIRSKPDEFTDLKKQIVKFKSENQKESYGQASHNQKEIERIKQR